MHETDFIYSQTQQANREKQLVTMATDGHYEIQTLHVAVNTSELEEEMGAELTVTWGERTSDPIAVGEEGREGPSWLSSTRQG